MHKSKDKFILQQTHLEYALNLLKKRQERKQLLCFKHRTYQSLPAVQKKKRRTKAFSLGTEGIKMSETDR